MFILSPILVTRPFTRTVDQVTHPACPERQVLLTAESVASPSPSVAVEFRQHLVVKLRFEVLDRSAKISGPKSVENKSPGRVFVKVRILFRFSILLLALFSFSFAFLSSNSAMESWLSDVQRVRIPRPKFGTGNSVRRSNSTAQHVRPDAHARQGLQDVAKATEELRQALQDKL